MTTEVLRPVDTSSGLGPGRRWPFRASGAVLALGFAITAALSFVAYHVNDSNQERLLRLQVREAGSVLSGVLPSIESPLSSAASFAALTGARPATFTRYMATYVPSEYATASLWKVTGSSVHELVSVGGPAELSSNADPAAFILAGARAKTMHVSGVLDPTSKSPRLGYAVGAGGYVVYAESRLPASRKLSVASNSAFSELRYAFYVGRVAKASNLVATDIAPLPVTGEHATDVIAFGDSSFILVASPTGALDDDLEAWLWWIVAIGGALLSIGAAGLTEQLVRQRHRAELAAAENRRLYGEQRGIAATLQHALLPETLPVIAGLDVRSRYVPGVEGLEVGGDWYDVLDLDEGRYLIVVGDVSGRGLRAATIMASLRYSTRAYARDGDAPAEILRKLCGLLNVERDGHFATVLCAQVDLGARRIELANAGHLEPLIIAGAATAFLSTDIGPPIGVLEDFAYVASSIEIAEGTTFLAFTDGLVERKGESLEVSLERLRTAASSGGTLDAMLTRLLETLLPQGAADDTAILALRWTS